MSERPSGAPGPATDLVVLNWNINSVRARAEALYKLIRKVRPEVILLQETRCPNANFPLTPFRRRGFKHVALDGRSGHHGVAILSRRPISDVRAEPFGPVDEARHVSAVIDHGGPLRLHSLYVPSGGDEPDPAINEKFAAKLAFVEAMAAWCRTAGAEPSVVAGDLNIAPYPEDVWSHAQLLSVISHTPAETSGLERARVAGGFIDIVHRDREAGAKVFTWWSYRNKVWPGTNRGRRLDHVWASPSVASRVRADILTETRGWPKASDHVPLVVRIARAGADGAPVSVDGPQARPAAPAPPRPASSRGGSQGGREAS